MGVLEVEVWHDGVWNQVFREGGKNYDNVWHTSTIDLSVGCISFTLVTYTYTLCVHIQLMVKLHGTAYLRVIILFIITIYSLRNLRRMHIHTHTESWVP